jgi:hypothetical protein
MCSNSKSTEYDLPDRHWIEPRVSVQHFLSHYGPYFLGLVSETTLRHDNDIYLTSVLYHIESYRYHVSG